MSQPVGKKMEKRKCFWKGCKKDIEIDVSYESSGLGKNFGIMVTGYCEFHDMVYSKQIELFEKMGKPKGYPDMAMYLYKTNRKKYDAIVKKAIKSIKPAYLKQLQKRCDEAYRKDTSHIQNLAV